LGIQECNNGEKDRYQAPKDKEPPEFGKTKKHGSFCFGMKKKVRER